MIRIIRWAARILGFLTCAFFLSFIIGEGIPDILKGRGTKELLPFLPLLGIAVAGYAVAWFSEKKGAIMLLAGGFAMGVYHVFNGGWKDIDAAAIYSLPFIVCGVMFLTCRFKEKPRIS